MKHGSLFSGIGGFDLAAEWMGWDNTFHCEWNKFGQKVLKHHFPKAISYDDITKTDFTIHRGRIDVLSGGFPCQPYSVAGKRQGKNDERHLWPHMLRAIREIKPSWVVGENVRGLVNWNEGMVFEEVCAEMEDEGFEVLPFILPAASVNAPHRRDRVWFIAHSIDNLQRRKARRHEGESRGEGVSEWDEVQHTTQSSEVLRDATNSECFRLEHTKEDRDVQESSSETQSKGCDVAKSTEANGIGRNATNSEGQGLEGSGIRWRFTNSIRKRKQGKVWENFPTQPPICGGDDGIPRELDNITIPKWRKESLMAYGNAIVPQVAHQIFKSIKQLSQDEVHKTTD